jgi:SHS2 domain-containing protein
VGVRVFGGSKEELFANAALAMFETMADLSQIEPRQKVEVEAHAEGVEILLNEWLSQLLRKFVFDGLLFSRCQVLQLSERKVSGRLWGEQFDEERHDFRTEIKAVTFHQLSVRQEGDGWVAVVIFDV